MGDSTRISLLNFRAFRNIPFGNMGGKASKPAHEDGESDLGLVAQNEANDKKVINSLTHTPLKTRYTIEDTFWSVKRKLIPDYSVMERVDTHVAQVPSYLKTNPQDLVSYLTTECEDDVQKVRAISRWIGLNIKYDGTVGTAKEPTVDEVLRMGRALCEGFGVVFAHFAELAGIACKRIYGQTKGAKYYPGCFDPDRIASGPGSHVWVCVTISGYPCLMDPTWASGSYDKSSGTGKANWDESWFICEPKSFLSTHLPLDGDEINTKDQLLNRPLRKAKKWAERVRCTPLAKMYGLKPLTHKEGELETVSGDVIIKYKCRFKLKHWVKLKRVESKQRIVEQDASQVVLYTVGSITTVCIHLPTFGTFDIDIIGQVKNSTESVTIPTKLLQYRVVNNVGVPFPRGVDDTWGATSEFSRAGFKIISPKQSAIIKTIHGKAVVKIKTPTRGAFPNMYHLTCTKLEGNNAIKEDHDEYVYSQRDGKFVTYFIQCPKSGKFKFEIMVKYEESKSGLYVGAAFLVVCTHPPPELFPIDKGTMRALGPDKWFFDCGLANSTGSSTIPVKGNQAEIVIDKSKKCSIQGRLYLPGKTISELADCVNGKDSSQAWRCIITPPVRGLYVLKIFAAQGESTTATYAGSFGIPYQVKL